MPYKKRRPVRSGPFVRFQKKDSTAMKALKVAYNVRQLVNVEFKEINKTLNTTIGTTANLQLLNGCVKGSDQNDRVGQSIRIKSIENRSYATYNASSGPNAQSVRRVVVLDLQPNQAAPSGGFSTIFEAISTEPMIDLRNLNYKQRFVILKDDIVHLSANEPRKSFPDYYHKMNMHTTFVGTDTGTISDIATGAIYAVFIADHNTNPPALASYSRIRFIDN